MKHWVFVVLAAAVLTACDPAPPGPRRSRRRFANCVVRQRPSMASRSKLLGLATGRQCGDFYRTHRMMFATAASPTNVRSLDPELSPTTSK